MTCLSSNEETSAVCVQKLQASHCCMCQEPGCGRAFKFLFQLIAHMRWHKGREGYVCRCPDCKLRFETSSTLRKHVRTHIGEKSYRFDVCRKVGASTSCNPMCLHDLLTGIAVPLFFEISSQHENILGDIWESTVYRQVWQKDRRLVT
jgi:hypothetical protein